MMTLKSCGVICAGVLATMLSAGATVQADGYGTITGRFVYDGDLPSQAPLFAKGADIKDAAVCSAMAIPNQGVVVDPGNKGIANIFIYQTKVRDINPDLEKSKKEIVKFDQKGCVFEPHAMVVRTDQKVQVVSSDGVAHNTHTYPFKNDPLNFILRPNDHTGVTIEQGTSESVPFKVTCDIHPWMEAWWLIVDHPYAAVTNTDGSFTIEGLPEGEQEFRVWQEKAGYIDRRFKVDVKAGQTVDLGDIKVKGREFE